jgi:hypothetical protein
MEYWLNIYYDILKRYKRWDLEKDLKEWLENIN